MIEDVRSAQVHCRPGETAQALVTLHNPDATAASVPVTCVLLHDLDRELARQTVRIDLPAGGRSELRFAFPLGGTEYGHEFRAWCGDAGDARSAVFGVSGNVGKVGILGGSAYANYIDVFAWAPDDFGDLSPSAAVWYSGQTGRRYTRAELVAQLEAAHRRGVKCLTYGKGVAGGPHGMALLLTHPDWAAYNRFGQLGGLDMSLDVWSLKHWGRNDQRNAAGRFWRFWNCWTPNFTRAEPVRYGAEALVRGAESLGWDGVRFDAQFDVFGGFDLAGHPLPAGPARDAVNGRNVRTMKAIIRARFPDFTFGYNYGLPTHVPTALDRAVCAEGGLVMDEGIRNASDPQHPLQDWRLYARHIREESRAVRRLGGVPLIFGSGFRPPVSDYAMAFLLAGGGTPYGWDFGHCAQPWDALATRCSALLWDPALQPLAAPERVLGVETGSRQLWWHDWVRAGLSPEGRPRLLVHLFNPPPAALIRETRDLAPPADGVTVHWLGPNAPGDLRAWLVTCDGAPRIAELTPRAAAAGGTQVEVGRVGVWALLVLEGEPLRPAVAAALATDTTRADSQTADSAPAAAAPPAALPPLDLRPAPVTEPPPANTARAVTLDNGRILLDNGRLRFEIDPRHGGRIASFVDRRDGLERVVPGRLEGLFFDNVYDQDDLLYQGQWSISQAAPYDAEIVAPGPDAAVVRVWREAFAEEGGVPNPNYAGLLLEREFRLAADSAVLTCTVRIRNRADAGRCPAYSLRHGYIDGARREGLRCFRPSRRGILPAGPALPESDQMVWDPAAGWSATLDLESGRGVAWLMDAGRVMMFYNAINAVTGRHIEEYPNRYGVDPLYIWDQASISALGADWYYHRAFIPAGSTWETTVTLLPLQGAGTNEVVHASRRLVAGLTCRRAPDGVAFDLTLLPAAEPLADVRVALVPGPAAAGAGLPPASGPAAGARLTAPLAWRFPAVADVAPGQVVQFRVTGTDAAGQPVEERFPYVVAPDAAAAPVLPAPVRTLDYVSHVAQRPAAGAGAASRVLFLQGLGYERWGLDTALARRGAEVTESEFMKRRIATAVRTFPATLEEALGYDLIILAAADGFALSHEGVMILDDYVRSGGRLLVLGGLYAFGGGRWAEFGLDALLPLRPTRTFDLVAAGDEPLRADWAAWRRELGTAAVPARVRGVRWLHAVAAAPDAQVLASIGDTPAIAVRRHGEGLVLAVALAPLGSDEAEDSAFWSRPEWSGVAEALVVGLLR